MTSKERAGQLYRLCAEVLGDMEVVAAQGTVTDHLVAIDLVVEVVNKSLYSLTISQEMLDQIDDLLNQPYQNVTPSCEQILPLFGTAYRTLRRFQRVVGTWC